MDIKKNCIIYCRVSTATQAQEGESLDVQEKICRGIAERHELKVLKVFREPFSGRKEYRPIFDGEIMAYIKTHPNEVTYLIVKSIDRFTRGGSLPYERIKQELCRYGVELMDSTGIIQPMKNTLDHLDIAYGWSKYSPSGVAELITANQGNAEVRDILTRTIGQEIILTREGYHIGQATDGFLIDKIRVNHKKKSVQKPDPARAPYWIKIFEMRASGQYTDQEIVNTLNAMGFRTREFNRWSKSHEEVLKRAGGNPLTIKKLQKDIQNSIYCGVIMHKWTDHKPIKAKYEGLISIATFNAANRGKIFIKELGNDQFEVLYDYYANKRIFKRLKDNPLFPYKFILCPHCHKPFLGSSPAGKSKKGFPTYHCHRDHQYFGISKKEFETNVEKFLQSLKFNPIRAKALEITFINKYRERQKEFAHFSSQVSQQVADLKNEQANILNTLAKSTSEIVIKKLEEKVDLLEEEIKNAQTQRNKIEITEYDISAFIKEAKNIMEHPAERLMDIDNPIKRQAVFGLVFDKTPTYFDILNGTPELSPIFALSSATENEKSYLARAVGIEPTLEVLETPVLPLYYARLRPP